jgi:hypothetical protein
VTRASSIPPFPSIVARRRAEKKNAPARRGVSRRFEGTAYLVAGTEVVVVPDVVVVVEAVVAVAALGKVLVVLVVVVLVVSSTTLGASTLTSGFFSSGLLQATREVAMATRARADVNFFISGYSLLFDRSGRWRPV